MRDDFLSKENVLTDEVLDIISSFSPLVVEDSLTVIHLMLKAKIRFPI